MGDPDFYTRIAPWTKTATGLLAIVAGARTGVIVAAPAAGFSRFVLQFLASVDDNLAGTAFELQTSVAFAPVCRVVSRFASSLPIIRMLTNANDAALVIQNVGVQPGNGHFCIIYADTPQNLFSNLVLGSAAG